MSGRLALVTGGGIRVGRAIALGLGKAGFAVAVAYGRSADAAREVVAMVRADGGRAEAFRCDLATDAEGLVPVVRAAMGPLDVVVNNAASFETDGLDDFSRERFERQMAVNVVAPALIAQAARDDLVRDGCGRIINIADLSAERPFPGQLIHSMTKSALVNLTRSLARELAPRVQVHGVIPGPVAMPEHWTAEMVATEIAATPAGRVGSPDDVAAAVVWLATCPSFLTGTFVHVTGGLHL